MIREILKLGNPKLYETSTEITAADAPLIAGWVTDLHDTLMEYRRVYGAGRAVAAPQIGVQKRLLYLYDKRPFVFINPVLTFPDDETYELLDDCMNTALHTLRIGSHTVEAALIAFDKDGLLFDSEVFLLELNRMRIIAMASFIPSGLSLYSFFRTGYIVVTTPLAW